MALVGVLGASGETGRLVASLLAEHCDADLVLLGRRAEALTRVRAALPDPPRATTRTVDATDSAALTAALRDVDVVVATVPLIDHLNSALPAVATTLQYLDGTIRTPGVHVEGLVTDPARLLGNLNTWGATVHGIPSLPVA